MDIIKITISYGQISNLKNQENSKIPSFKLKKFISKKFYL